MTSEQTRKRWIGPALLYGLASLQNVVLFTTPAAIKPIHLIIGLLVFRSSHFDVPWVLRPLAFFYAMACVISVAAYFGNPFGATLANHILAVLVLVVVGGLAASRHTYADVVKGLQIAAFAIVTYVNVNIVRQWEDVRAALAVDAELGARADVGGLLYAGGTNLEATWPALAGAFFVRSRKGFPAYMMLSVVPPLALASRAALLVWAFVAVWGCAIRWGRRPIMWLVGIVLLIAAIGAFSPAFLLRFPVIERFTLIGNEPGSRGRLAIWEAGLERLASQPFVGSGLGNELKGVMAGAASDVDNVHNVYLGYALALGVVGFLLYVATSLLTLRRSVPRKELLVFLGVYQIASLIEFRGADTLFVAVLALLGGAKMVDKGEGSPAFSPAKLKGRRVS